MSGEMKYITLTEEQKRARTKRNIAIGLALFGFCALAFVVTIIRIHGNLNATLP